MPILCLDIAMKSLDVVAETRRRWTAEECWQIVAESETAPVSVVARRHELAVSQVFRWRRQAGLPGKRAGVKKAETVSVPVILTALSAPEASTGGHLLGRSGRSLLDDACAGMTRGRLRRRGSDIVSLTIQPWRSISAIFRRMPRRSRRWCISWSER